MNEIRYKKVSEKIRIVRLTLGYSQEYMAQELGISQNVYSKNERNMKDVSLERVIQICEILNIPFEGLLNN
ncbi:helix-turn-helix transcriptional regulator [Pedobacter sp. MR2016-19]|nr:helix-turn-helix transcriptional regulator [Pedobacter sp. MR2016-19]QXU41616.1 helix-turn-helix transcriptional regulator [Pedobacter sp. D749]